MDAFQEVFKISEFLIKDKTDENEITDDEIRLLDSVYTVDRKFSNWTLNQKLGLRSPKGGFKDVLTATMGAFRNTVSQISSGRGPEKNIW